MRTPEGWAAISLQLELGIRPRRDSILESCMLIHVQERQLANVLGVQALFRAILAPHQESAEGLGDTIRAFVEVSLPYLKAERAKSDTRVKEILKRWVSQGPLGVQKLGKSKPRFTAAGKNAVGKRVRPEKDPQ